jgi:hypothetical protein
MGHGIEKKPAQRRFFPTTNILSLASSMDRAWDESGSTITDFFLPQTSSASLAQWIERGTKVALLSPIFSYHKHPQPR